MQTRTDEQIKRDRETLVMLIEQDRQFLAEAQRAATSTKARLRILKGVLARTDQEIAEREIIQKINDELQRRHA